MSYSVITYSGVVSLSRSFYSHDLALAFAIDCIKSYSYDKVLVLYGKRLILDYRDLLV